LDRINKISTLLYTFGTVTCYDAMTNAVYKCICDYSLVYSYIHFLENSS